MELGLIKAAKVLKLKKTLAAFFVLDVIILLKKQLYVNVQNAIAKLTTPIVPLL